MPPRHITVRLATLADAAEIAALSRELIETGLGWSWTRARVARNIASSATTTLVA
jgi:ribosomal-protein-alanine N-acetyltransferase